MAKIDEAMRLFKQAQYHLERASALTAAGMKLVRRQSPIRRARPVHVKITAGIRKQVAELSQNAKLTQWDIARRVGLRNGGRVSEILNGKR